MTQWTAETILKTLSENHEKLRALGAVKLGLFGSYARGEQRPDSDMDFLVTLVADTFDSYMDIRFFLEDLFLCKVDLVLEEGIKPRIRTVILNEVIYAEGLQTLP